MVSLEELTATVVRMERRLGGLEDAEIQRLMRHYAELVPRFRADLESERDQLLSRGGALMLVQRVWKAEP